jgi:Ser-tRNA(Ala) deacylase AlaX
VIYDYVDTHIKVLEGMYHKRLRAYKKIGYEVCSNIKMEKDKTNAIFDNESYQQVYDNDLKSAYAEIVISSPGVNEKKVKWTLKLLREVIFSGVKVTVITLSADEYPDNRVEIIKNYKKVAYMLSR